MTHIPASQKVLGINELLEMILVSLPPKTLFGIIRVSKRFQTIIATTPAIQEKMFLRIRNKPQVRWALVEKPWPDDMESWPEEHPWPGHLQSSLKDYLDPQAFYIKASATLKSGRTAEHPPVLGMLTGKLMYRAPVTLNPFLRVFNDRVPCAPRACFPNEHWDEIVILDLNTPLTISTLYRTPPSILDTYLSDPPCKEIQVFYDYDLPDRNTSVCHRWRPNGGLTIRDALHTALELSHSTNNLGDGPHGTVDDLRRYRDFPGSEDNEYEPDEMNKLGERGFKAVEIWLPGTIVPTLAEWAAVEAGEVPTFRNKVTWHFATRTGHTRDEADASD